MIDLLDIEYEPALEEISEVVRNPLFVEFMGVLRERFRARFKVEYSKCSWEPGWNVKCRKSGKNLCTVYPRENYFTVLVVIGSKEKECAEALLPELAVDLRRIYRETEEGNGQRWLMIDLEDEGDVYRGVLQLIGLRAGTG